jgi:hypothetical protein
MQCFIDYGWPVNKSCAVRACILVIQRAHILRQAYKFVFSEYCIKNHDYISYLPHLALLIGSRKTEH